MKRTLMFLLALFFINIPLLADQFAITWGPMYKDANPDPGFGANNTFWSGLPDGNGGFYAGTGRDLFYIWPDGEMQRISHLYTNLIIKKLSNQFFRGTTASTRLDLPKSLLDLVQGTSVSQLLEPSIVKSWGTSDILFFPSTNNYIAATEDGLSILDDQFNRLIKYNALNTNYKIPYPDDYSGDLRPFPGGASGSSLIEIAVLRLIAWQNGGTQYIFGSSHEGIVQAELSGNTLINIERMNLFKIDVFNWLSVMPLVINGNIMYCGLVEHHAPYPAGIYAYDLLNETVTDSIIGLDCVVWSRTLTFLSPNNGGFLLGGSGSNIAIMDEQLNLLQEITYSDAPYPLDAQICSIVEDTATGKIWVSTDYGVTNFELDYLTSAAAQPPTILPAFQLGQNYPNPFNPATTIEVSLPSSANVSLIVYNTIGQQVRVLVDEQLPAGSHTVNWDGTNDLGQQAPTGPYFYKITADDFIQTRKMIFYK